MKQFFLRKIGWFAMTLAFVIVLVFVMVHATGIDPCRLPKSSKETIAACRRERGLDQPVHIQLIRYVEHLAHGDFGPSYQHNSRPVLDVLAEVAPSTFRLVTPALALAFLLGIAAGVFAAVRRNTRGDYTIMGLAMVGIAVPELIVGPVAVLVLAMRLDWIDPPDGHSVSTYLLAISTLTLPMTAAISRLARGGMLEILHEDFIRTAHAKGLRQRIVIVRHALRLGLTPVVSYAGPLIAGAFSGGSFVVESVFGIPGVGQQFVKAATGTPINTFMIMGTTIILVTLMLTMNFLVDLSYGVLDPRVRARETAWSGGSGWRGIVQTAGTILALVAATVGVVVIARFLVGATQGAMTALAAFTVKFPHLPVVFAVAWTAIGVAIVRSYVRAIHAGGSDRTLISDVWRRLRRHRAAVWSGVFLYGMVLACVLGPWLLEACVGVQYAHGVIELPDKAPAFLAWFGGNLKGVAPWPHVLGTDGNGRDLLARTLIGGRVSLAIGTAALLVSAIIGVTYGTAAAYFGNRVDNVLMRFVDMLYSIPFLILVIILIAFVGQSIILLFVAIGFVSWLTIARIARGQVLSLMQRGYVEAARTIGTPWWRIMLRHLIPNAAGPIIVYGTRLVAVLILEEALLSFLGLGVQEPEASWGLLIKVGNEAKEHHWWLLVFPATFLATTLYAFNYFGDGLRDALDTRLKGVDR